MESPDDFVDLENAPTPQIALMLREFLREEGIPAYVAGTQLWDEWAISQILLKRLAVKIQVPRRHHARARAILDELRASGKLLEEGSDPPPASPAVD